MFGVPWNSALVKQVTEAERSNRRRPIAHTKIRSEVRGGGKKPWRQKHTGRARHGSIRSPLWKGGGATFGPRKDRKFAKKTNKKMRRKALFAALSAKLKDGEIFFLDQLQIPGSKTRDFARVLKNFKMAGKSIGFINAGDRNAERASRNIARLSVLPATGLSALGLLSKKFILFPKDALPIVQKVFLSKNPKN